MSLFAYLNGSDRAHSVRLGEFGLTSRADGSPGVGSLIFDDEAAALTIRGWMTVIVRETACTAAPVLFSGYIADRTYSRSDGTTTYRTGASRFVNCNIIDQNAVLHIRLIDHQDGKRSAETHIERIDWLLGSYLSGLVEDFGEVNRANPRPFEDANYRGQYPDDVLADLAGPLYQIYFVYLTQPTGERGLFFNIPTATTTPSTLSISNRLVDSTSTCYFPLVDAELTRDPSEVYSRVRLSYRNGVVVESDTGTLADFFTDNDLGHRGLQIDSNRIGLESTARTFADRTLERDSSEQDTITVTITDVPPSQAGLIDAGQRIGVRFTHLPGYDDPSALTYTRVTARTITQLRDDLYQVQLELATHGLSSAGGGGGGGTFPGPPAVTGPCGDGTIQMSIASNTNVSPESFTVAAGQYVYVLAITRDVTFLGTSVWDFWFDSAVALAPIGGTTAHPLASYDSGNPLGGPTSTGTWLAYEYDPPTAMHAVARGTASESGPWVIDGSGISPLYLGYWDAAGGGGNVIAPGTYRLRSGNVLDGYFSAVGYTGSVCVIVSSTPPASFTAPTTSDAVGAPDPGVPEPPAAPNETPNGVTTVFTTVYPYADRTLVVFVNGVDVTDNVTESDPAAGEFTFAHAPPTGAEIQVEYLGR